MGYCVYIDLGDGDFIKPQFSKPPTPEMIQSAKEMGIAMKRKMADLKARGICGRCEGKKTVKGRDYDSPGFKLIDKPCAECNGTGNDPRAKAAQGGGENGSD